MTAAATEAALRAAAAGEPLDCHRRLRLADHLAAAGRDAEALDLRRAVQVQRVCAAPADPAPRAAYADLVRAADPDRADFIATQLHLWNARPPVGATRDHTRSARLRLARCRAREERLWHRHGRRWGEECRPVPGIAWDVRLSVDVRAGDHEPARDDPDHMYAATALFAGGFVDRLRCSWVAFQLVEDALCWHPSRARLTCAACWGVPPYTECTCRGGFVVRPCPATAQPVTAVELIGDHFSVPEIRTAPWPWLKFVVAS